MLGFIVQAVVTAIGLWASAKLVPGVGFTSTGSLIAAAVILGVVNAFVRPLMVILTLPLTIVTFGLFLLVVNAAMIGLTAMFLGGFVVDGLWAGSARPSSPAWSAGSPAPCSGAWTSGDNKLPGQY